MSPLPSAHLTVDFEHWRVELHDEWLTRFGSPHFEPSRARSELLTRVVRHGVQQGGRHTLRFDRAQIIVANEVFPEAAMADPLADLEVWNEWSSGVRAFPYPGRFSRLGLVTQEGKTSATSSVGVLGEIMAGLFAQAGISPTVLVRVVRRWPDFIYTIGDRYAFVEAKAFTMRSEPGNEHLIPNGLGSRVQAPLLSECAHQAVLQLNADPAISVWGAFTAIRRIDPFELSVTFVEFDCGEHRRYSRLDRTLPQAVITGVAQRALSMAATRLAPQQLQQLQTLRRTNLREEVERQLVTLAQPFADSVLFEAGPQSAVDRSRGDVRDEIAHLARLATVPEQDEGRQFFAARALAAQGQAALVRAVGNDLIQVVDLSHTEIKSCDALWRPHAWESAVAPYSPLGPRAWRFGGLVYMVR